jgi:hypothetical protein
MVVEAIKALDNEDYQSAGSQTSFALDAVEVERPGGVTGDGGAASGASSVGRDVRVGGSGLLCFLGLRRAPAPH